MLRTVAESRAAGQTVQILIQSPGSGGGGEGGGRARSDDGGFGACSFSIWSRDGRLVFDSGADFVEVITDQFEPEAFNSADDKTDLDHRSDDKGVTLRSVQAGSGA